jgi:hypothetical protein
MASPTFSISVFRDGSIQAAQSEPAVPLLPLAQFIEWQNGILASRPNIYRLQKWGQEPLSTEGSRDVNNIGTSNFQAIGLYNKVSNTPGGTSNWLKIPHTDIMRVAAMQVEDNYVDKVADWRDQKMRWLIKPSGTVYFGGTSGDWHEKEWVSWGTIGLGYNLVKVEGVEMLRVKTPDGQIRIREMARLAGFKKSDFGRPLTDLLADGLVHRGTCVYLSGRIGDTPKGIIYTPFWKPGTGGWEYYGAQGTDPEVLYVPFSWVTK